MTTNKPIIGITLDHEETPDYALSPWYALRENYCHAVREAGGVPLLLPHYKEDIAEYQHLIDGVILTGGHFDIHPELYGDSALHETVTLKSGRTDFEWAITEYTLQHHVPILGICGGHQLINVVLGGTLIQHIPDTVAGALPHEARDRNVPAHDVAVTPGTLLHRIIGAETLGVNTTHHQAVDTPGRGVTVNAMAPDGVIEGIEYGDHPFCLGVQWHPEYKAADDPVSRPLFAAFGEAVEAWSAGERPGRLKSA